MWGALLALTAGAAPPADGLAAGAAFLARHVPSWHRENRCFSCHHDGDAARALFALGGGPVNTLRWLQRPEGWAHNGGDGPFSDRKLAALQFAAALSEADRSGLLVSNTALAKAARLAASFQERDGRWHVTDGPPGPTTWGDPLATALTLSVLRRAGGFREEVRRAEGWLRALRPESAVDAAAAQLALGGKAGLGVLLRAQGRSGGWGPYATSPPEAFDTALAVLALPPGEARSRGRRWLLEAQLPDGSWPETTRPSGGESYAQRLSTAAWAILALKASAP